MDDKSRAVRWQPLVGRSAEIGRIRALTCAAGDGADRALVVLGEAGIGKSAVLADLIAHADACGLRVLSAAGREYESGLPFAVLRQLLRPVLAELRALPGTHAAELLAAVGMAGAGVAPGRDLAGSALLGLLDLLARHAEPGRGLVTVIDDAQWIDRASYDVLAFAAYRLDARPVTMILAARGDAPPAGLEGGLPELRLGPLSAAEASDLLDAQPCPPRGRARAQVLAQAAGNPLALIELTRTVTGDPAAERTWAGLPLPLTDRLSTLFGARLVELPALTRDALLLGRRPTAPIATRLAGRTRARPGGTRPSRRSRPGERGHNRGTFPSPADPVGCLSSRAICQPRRGTPAAGRTAARPARSPRLAPGCGSAAAGRGHRVAARRDDRVGSTRGRPRRPGTDP